MLLKLKTHDHHIVIRQRLQEIHPVIILTRSIWISDRNKKGREGNERGKKSSCQTQGILHVKG